MPKIYIRIKTHTFGILGYKPKKKFKWRSKAAQLRFEERKNSTSNGWNRFTKMSGRHLDVPSVSRQISRG
jgi:hypothetical protein